jgi:hypothetical protein
MLMRLPTLALPATAPMLALGGLPALAQRAVLIGFTMKMMSDAPEVATALGDEFGKPPDQRDPDKVSSLVSDAIQITGFSTLGALGAAKGGPGPGPGPEQVVCLQKTL